MQEKVSVTPVLGRLKNLPLVITVRHHSASLMMPSSGPRDRILNPHQTVMIDSCNIC